MEYHIERFLPDTQPISSITIGKFTANELATKPIHATSDPTATHGPGPYVVMALVNTKPEKNQTNESYRILHEFSWFIKH